MLLVDDDEMLRHALVENLPLHEEFAIDEAITGADALQLVRGGSYQPRSRSASDPLRTLRVCFTNKRVPALKGLCSPLTVSNKEGAFVHFYLTFHTLP